MGLDSYFRKICAPGETAPVFYIPENYRLVGGLCSGNGHGGSFRGKVYNGWVESITGQSLYQEEIDSVTVRAMAQKLERFWKDYKPEDRAKELRARNDFFADCTDDEINAEFDSLRFIFSAYAEHSYRLYGWW